MRTEIELVPVDEDVLARLTLGARGRGAGRSAVAAVLGRARLLGAREVRADTSSDNASALYVLQRVGFRTPPAGDRATAGGARVAHGENEESPRPVGRGL